MKVSECMTRDVQIAGPQETLQEAARKMAEWDIGFMPVGEKDRLVGTVTDRDMVVRALAAGKDGRTRVADVMSKDVRYCFEDEDMDHVVENMGDLQVRRLPVVSREKRLVGVLSLADAAQAHSPEAVGIAMTGICEPGGAHTQSVPRG